MAVILLLVARAAPWKVVLGAVLGMIAVWAIFRLALGVRLPTGDFWDALRDLTTNKPNGR
jgi:Na+-transporting NADH:ubiquinone oxidoreductase subunit NqrB